MVTPTQNTLLALLLSLKDLDVSLSPTEQTELAKVGQQLYLAPRDWNYIETGLMKVIEGNYSLKQGYQAAKAKLDVIGGKLPANLLPTKAELQVELPTDSTRQIRGFKPGESSQADSEEIINDVVVPILRDNDPPKTAIISKLRSDKLG